MFRFPDYLLLLLPYNQLVIHFMRHSFCFNCSGQGINAMVEFTLSFRFEEKDRRAGVVKSEKDEGIEYDIRPADPSIVKRFGKQIIIYKEKENYNAETNIDFDYRSFFDSLVDALKNQDQSENEKPSE